MKGPSRHIPSPDEPTERWIEAPAGAIRSLCPFCGLRVDQGIHTQCIGNQVFCTVPLLCVNSTRLGTVSAERSEGPGGAIVPTPPSGPHTLSPPDAS